jgi:predicted nucleic acid-binding protein
MALVLDACVALAWCFPDESSGHAVSILHRLSDETAIVPSIWPLEVANADQLSLVARLLKELSIEIESASIVRTFDGVARIAVTHTLSVYDAAYLELAQRLKLPIATPDKKLAIVAKTCAIEVI